MGYCSISKLETSRFHPFHSERVKFLVLFSGLHQLSSLHVAVYFLNKLVSKKSIEGHEQVRHLKLVLFAQKLSYRGTSISKYYKTSSFT